MISLQAQNLTKKFNQHTIFKDLSFIHNKGILGIAGANGSGKSTLMQCLAHLIRLNSGSIIWNKNEILMNQKELKSHIGIAAPYINLYTELSVFENLRFLIEVGGNSVDEERLLKLLDYVEILHFKNQLYGSLSTGQQQRVKLAASLVRNPDILMLDEPGSNLDEKGQSMVSKIVQEASESGKLVLLASNNPAEITLCDAVIEME